MFAQMLIGFLAGIVAGVSPCILPILPVILVGWTTTENPPRSTRRSLAVVAGLVLSFSLITALGSVLLSTLHLSDNFLHRLGIVALGVFGLSLIVPRLEQLIERPFARLGRPGGAGTSSGFVFGLSLGLVFVPCAGPVLATISVLGARHQASVSTVVMSLCFGLGAALPLLAIATAGSRLIERNRRLASRVRKLRPLAGAVLVALALALNFNLLDGLQRMLPGYTQSLQHAVEENSYAAKQLRELRHRHATGSLAPCESRASFTGMGTLSHCGVAPEFTGITAWRNTAHNQPLTMKSLRGHVVLVDFWTYSCINCQRNIPHVEAWYERYRRSGLEVVGVASPEFAFEHDVNNVTQAAKRLGIRYPIAMDPDLATWNAYANQYWPAEYLVDAQGIIRHVSYGEGRYPEEESFIRALLHEASPTTPLPVATSVVDQTPHGSISPETYLGTKRSQFLVNNSMVDGQSDHFKMPTDIPFSTYGLGGAWTPSSECITAGEGARLTINVRARNVYLVMSGRGTVKVSLDGRRLAPVDVEGIPTLYTVLHSSVTQTGLLTITFPVGVSAYAFTFG